jgi:hypothetical protein
MSSELPFGRAVKHLERTLGVVVHASTARRQTLAVGQRMLERQNQQAQPLSTCPEENAAERMAMSSDGSMVPLVGGVWAARQSGGDWCSRTAHAQERGARRDDRSHLLCTHGQCRHLCGSGQRRTAQAWDRASQGSLCDPGRSRVDPGVCAKPSPRCAAHAGRGPILQNTSMRWQTRCARVADICPAWVGGWRLAPTQT